MIALAQGARRTNISSDNLYGHRFGSREGILFDLQAVVLDGPEYCGTARMSIADGRLCVLYFLAAVPCYFDKYIASAQAVIGGAVL